MGNENSKAANLKEKAVHEFKQFVLISFYLTFFFWAVATYKMLLLNQFHQVLYGFPSRPTVVGIGVHVLDSSVFLA